MNDEPDQVDGAAHGPQTSALCERLFRRHSESIGIINVREDERLYERRIGWRGAGQPFVLEQSFGEMINASSAPAPGSALPSQTVSLPLLSQSISTEAH